MINVKKSQICKIYVFFILKNYAHKHRYYLIFLTKWIKLK